MDKLETMAGEVEQKVEAGVNAVKSEMGAGAGGEEAAAVKMPEVFLWTKPIKSGIVFVCGLAVYVLLEVMEYTVLGLLTQVTTYVLLAALAYAGFKIAHVKFLSGAPMDPNRASWPLASFSLDPNAVHNGADAAVATTNALLRKAKDVFYVQNIVVTIQALVVSFVASYVFTWVGFNTVVFAAFFLLFTVPITYAKFQPQIDPILAKVQAQVSQLSAMVPTGAKAKSS